MIWRLRHGEAAEGSPDSERPLTAKGERQARAAGRALSELGGRGDVCLTSPKGRAADTAKLACDALGVEPEHEPKLAGGPFDPPPPAAGDENAVLGGPQPPLSMAVHT